MPTPQRPPYRSVWGIATGDIVTTSYGSGPYEVWEIVGPRYTSRFPGTLIVHTYPVIYLVLIIPGTTPRDMACDYFFINDIRQDGERYLIAHGSELFVTAQQSGPALQMDLFASGDEAPYDWQPGVNYDAGDGCVWHCGSCGQDFNTEPDSAKFMGPAYCPRCVLPADRIIVMCPGLDARSGYQRAMGVV